MVRPPHRVLVIDDDESIRTFVGGALRYARYEVLTAMDGLDALRVVEQARPFDLLVIDVLMPQMRGDALARDLRQRDPDAKILNRTGYSD